MGFEWLIIGGLVILGVELVSWAVGSRAQEQLEDVKKDAAKLRGEAAVRKLELERGNTLSQLTARAGRAGVEVASASIVPAVPEVLTKGGKVKHPGIPMRVDATGAGGSVLAQQQRVADLYEQDIIYSKKMMALEMEGSEIQADYAAASAAFDVVGSILETGTDLYASWYRYDQMKIPDSYDPYKRKLGFGESWGVGY